MDRKPQRCAKILAIAVCAAVLAAPAARAAGHAGSVDTYDKKIREKSAALDSIKTEIERGRQRLAELSKKEGVFLERLSVLEKNIETVQQYLAVVGNRITVVNAHIGALTDSLKQANAALAKRQQAMRLRLRTMYKTGNLAPLEILFSSADVTDMLSRVRYFQELKNYDRGLLHSIDSTRVVIRAHTQALGVERDQLVALQAAKQSEAADLAAQQQSHQSMLSKVKSEKSAYVSMVKELERAQEELTLLIKELEKKRRDVKADIERGKQIAFENRKGKLPWPVEGTIARQFGKIVHPVYKTVIMNTGVDIAARKGASVVCVAPGRVDYVGWMRGYGKFVIVNHFDGYMTIYAHLGDISVIADQEVQYGTVLGAVGESGSLEGAGLNFQIRKSAEPQDPAAWLEPKQ